MAFLVPITPEDMTYFIVMNVVVAVLAIGIAWILVKIFKGEKND